MRLIAGKKGIKVKKTLKIDELYEILRKYDKIIYDESLFKSIISDIRSILPKTRCKKLKKCLKYIEEIRELTYLQIEKFKNCLINLKFKKINRIKKADIL